ncbi:MAG: 1,4-dihydroxy-6-naphthoate synthase [Desulfovibrionaceae bacterium]|nr:1,4-dihydroxy-6-naphthoate synthase [Desulfovibrionaceae bacterium]
MAEGVLSLGHSPCPNDTFIFYALTHGLVPAPCAGLDLTLADVEVLNRLAAQGAMDVCKVSVAAAAGILEQYVLLRSGGAMGRGVGPLVVARKPLRIQDLEGKAVAAPGPGTTAGLLLNMLCREAGVAVRQEHMVFDQVMPAVAQGAVEAGVVIHEGRFTFGGLGLVLVQDLGQWWEGRFNLPLPLGAIAARRDLGRSVLRGLDQAVRHSLLFARQNRDAVWPYVKSLAREMDDAVIERHITTFVNDFSLDVGLEGERAAAVLLAESARARGLALADKEIFLSAG